MPRITKEALTTRLTELEDRVARLEILLPGWSKPSDCLPPLPARLLDLPPAPHIPPSVTCRISHTSHTG